MRSSLQSAVKLSVTTEEDCWLKDTLAFEVSIWICPLLKHMHMHKHRQPGLLSKKGGIGLLSPESYF